MDVRLFFLQEFKEEEMLVFKHIPGQASIADIFTKNVVMATLYGHMAKLFCHDGFLDLLKNSKP